MTCLLVALGWVLFRAHDFPHAGRYFAALVGIAEVQPATAILWSVLFPPYHIACVLVGLAIVWFAPTAWRFSEHITPGKAIFSASLFLFSIVLLSLQQYNPFIYFLF